MRTIAIINLKGGVAKTTSSINIAYILTTRGYKVLLVDNDKQGDCSRGLNRRTSDGDGIDRIMTDRHPDMQSLIRNTDYEGLDIITANLGLLTANMEVTMDRVRPQQNRLRKALQQVADQYDFCVVDNAPDINVCIVLGKGNKERTVYLTDVALLHLQTYLDSRSDTSTALFAGRGTDRMTKAGIEAALKRIGTAAGVENVHPHRFRRTLATNLLDRGMDIQDVARILGHADLKTTQIYCYINQNNVKNAYRKYAI